MNSPPLRAIALVLLILCFAMFSGIVATVSALERPERIDACCDRERSEQEPASAPCSESDCLCFSCLALGVASNLPSTCQLRQGADDAFCPPAAFCLDGFSASIDYPPENA